MWAVVVLGSVGSRFGECFLDLSDVAHFLPEPERLLSPSPSATQLEPAKQEELFAQLHDYCGGVGINPLSLTIDS
jgi:hypothetical protein